jgi:hypothetical protein
MDDLGLAIVCSVCLALCGLIARSEMKRRSRLTQAERDNDDEIMQQW